MRSSSNPNLPRTALAALLVAALAAAFAGAPAAAQFGGPRPEPIVSPDQGGQPSATDDVDFEQKLGSQVPMDAELADETGRRVTLAQLSEGRPMLLVPAYYECPMLCNMVLSGVTSSLGVVDLDAGRDFEVMVVSFDPEETPELAARTKAPLMKRYNRPGAEEGFHFLTGSEASVRRVMDSIGFHYAYVPARDEWAHAAGIVALTPDGQVSRYHYGVEFPARDLRLSLVEAGGGTIGSAVDQVLLYCLHYDPATGEYSLAILNLVRGAGALTVLALGAFLFVGWRRSKSHPALGEG
jgi:protein SCO1/2